MALTATMRRFEVDLSDTDRNVYEQLDLRAAQHPSETDRYLVTRVLARCLKHGEGVDFSRGLQAAEEPAILRHDLRGDVIGWIEIGSPSVEKLHRAMKKCAEVAVFTHRDETVRELQAAEFHRKEALELYRLDANFLDEVGKTLDRVNRWNLAVSAANLYLRINERDFTTEVTRISL